ncbi:MAG: hypothetical protein U1E65_09940 [Myxococcota bacterium]
MRRWQLGLIALVIVVALLVLWPRPARSPNTSPGASARPAEVIGPVDDAGHWRGAYAPPVAPAAPAPKPARLHLERPAPNGPDAAGLHLAPQRGPLKDRREHPGPDAPRELELVHAGLDTIQEDIEACLAQWSESDHTATGTITIGFQLDESGLTDSWVSRGEELPFGVRTCFANAVYGLDWSHIVSRPAEITNNYELRDDRDR